MATPLCFSFTKVLIQRLTETHSVRNGDGAEMLTNAIGMGNAALPHYFEQELAEGDIVVITSDGLTHLLSDAEIGDYVRRFGTAKALVHEAVRTSKSKALDDLSAIVVEDGKSRLRGIRSPRRTNTPLKKAARSTTINSCVPWEATTACGWPRRQARALS